MSIVQCRVNWNDYLVDMYAFLQIINVPIDTITLLGNVPVPRGRNIIIAYITDGFGVPLKLISVSISQQAGLYLDKSQSAALMGYQGKYILISTSYIR